MASLAHSGMTTRVVTHAIRFAREAADGRVMLDEGVLIEEGTLVGFVGHTKHERSKAFLSQIL